MKKKLLFLWLAMLGVLLAMMVLTMPRSPKDVDIPASEFVSKVENGEITKVIIVGNKLHGETTRGTGVNSYVTEKEELLRTLHNKHVPYEEREPSDYNGIIYFVLKFGIPLVFLFFVMRSIKNAGPNGAIKSHSEHKAKLQDGVKTTFADVAGVDEAVEECRDLVTCLKDPKKFATLGGRIPKGVLLVGPPGNGKTLLARAVAGEAGVPFFAGSASEFVEMFVGTGAARVRDLFGNAKKNMPCIVFIDEIDAVGKKRSGLTGIGGHTEMEQTLNQILVEMDGFAQNEEIIVMAATIRPETLDPALTRSGRFDRMVVVPPPDVRGREAILKVHARNKPLAPDVDLSVIARGTPGLVGADLAKLLNEAALGAAKLDKKAIDMEDIECAKEKVFMGPERKSAVLSPKTREILAWHEAGHALVGWFTPEAFSPHRVTIIPRGMALGITWFLPPEDVVLKTRSELLADIKVGLGGRAAEKLLLGEDNYTTGASNDLDNASGIAERMVKEFGMGQGLGPGSFAKKQGYGFGFDSGANNYSEATAAKLDAEQRRILEVCESEVTKLVQEKRPLLEALAKLLLEKETVGLEHLLGVFGPRKLAT